jgi:hypothetical protein
VDGSLSSYPSSSRRVGRTLPDQVIVRSSTDSSRSSVSSGADTSGMSTEAGREVMLAATERVEGDSRQGREADELGGGRRHASPAGRCCCAHEFLGLPHPIASVVLQNQPTAGRA